MNKANQMPTLAGSGVYELIIFNKTGACLYHHDLMKSKLQGNLKGLYHPDNTPQKVKEKEKLVFGLLWSLKSFSQMVSCDQPG